MNYSVRNKVRIFCTFMGVRGAGGSRLVQNPQTGVIIGVQRFSMDFSANFLHEFARVCKKAKTRKAASLAAKTTFFNFYSDSK